MHTVRDLFVKLNVELNGSRRLHRGRHNWLKVREPLPVTTHSNFFLSIMKSGLHAEKQTSNIYNNCMLFKTRHLPSKHKVVNSIPSTDPPQKKPDINVSHISLLLTCSVLI